jgi:type IV secretory pathway VirD2 relaxase
VDDERPFRLRPRRPRYGRDESRVWARGFQQLMHLVRMTTKPVALRLGRGSRNYRNSGLQTSRHNQRCAVRLTYTRNKTRGLWGAHGRYIVRDSATALRPDGTAAFGSTQEPVNIPQALAAWQKSGDERLFKFVFSPEFGERLDLERLTRDVMAAVEADVGRPLEWAAVVHRNTEHAHVHTVLRGVADGKPLRFAREYVQHGIRQHAEEACTLQLGYRTSLDMEEAERREVAQARFTSLDRILGRARSGEAASSFEVSPRPDAAELTEFARAREQRLVARLNYLAEIGLAEQCGPLTWEVRRDFESALRTFQRAQDRQKVLAQHAAFLSDPRLQYRVLTPDATAELDGRVIAHVLDEISDRPNALIEGVEGIIYYVPHDPAIAEARANGKLKPNSFVQLRTVTTGGSAARTVKDLGDADQILSNHAYFKRAILRMAERGILDDQAPRWSGWLGRYHEVLHEEVKSTLESQNRHHGLHKETERGR